jgi:hypothetical protein
MAKCDYCGTTILFGGVREGNLRFCNADCHTNGYLCVVAEKVPEDIVAEHLSALHQGNCPKCGGPGPVDLHTAHFVWSAFIMTSWRSRPEVCCRWCGKKAKLGGLLSSATLGWWGIPWGIVLTPVQVIRNVAGLLSSPDPTQPSAELANIVRIQLASQFVDARREQKSNDWP